MKKLPFQTVTPKQQSAFQQLFRQLPDENAIVELNNLLASKHPMEVKGKDVQDINLRYKLDVCKEFALNLLELYAVWLNHSLQNREIEDLDWETLEHLKSLFKLPSQPILDVHREIGGLHYRKRYRRNLWDGLLNRADAGLQSALERLGLSPSAMAQIELEEKSAYMASVVKNHIQRASLSPDESSRLGQIASTLGVELAPDPNVRMQLDRLKRLWAFSNLPVPIVPTDTQLYKEEVVHFRQPFARWYEWRGSHQERNNPLTRLSPIELRRFFVHVTYEPSPVASLHNLKPVGQGEILLTNKRILLLDGDKPTSIRLDRIQGFLPSKYGVEIDKLTGKNTVLVFSDQLDGFCILLERLLIPAT